MTQTEKLEEEIHQSDSFLMPSFTGEEPWCVHHHYLINPHIILLSVAHTAKTSVVLTDSVRCLKHPAPGRRPPGTSCSLGPPAPWGTPSWVFGDGPLLALSDGGTRPPAEGVERSARARGCGLTNAGREAGAVPLTAL